MSTASSRIGRGLAKGLGIRLEHDIPRKDNGLDGAGFDTYIERDPTPSEWLRGIFPTGSQIGAYFYNSLPFIQWIGRYNRRYFSGDIVAGITVGAVIVPESIAYARLAGLPPEFGLYTAFLGSLTYWIFATSKDISLGPVAVMAIITGNIVSVNAQTHPDIPGHVIASTLALVVGVIIGLLGIFNLGFLVDLVPLPGIHAFMTGAALTIGTGQLPSLLGISHYPSENNESFVNTGDPAFRVFIITLKHLGEARLDAAMGLTALVTLYLVRYITTKASHMFPSQRKVMFLLSSLRITFVILLYTMVSWLVNRSRRDDPMFSILGTVPRGFQYLEIPTVNSTIIKTFANKLPVSVIVVLLEHIASAKSLGRINNYTIQPSQELLASGVANVFGAFFGSFTVSGSFARTAINSKAGIRTPMGGIVVSLVVLLAIYALTAVFFYFPTSVLSAIIIHAVGDLVTFPEETYKIWRISPIDFVIFITGVVLSVFNSIETGIYATVSISAGVLFFRLMRTPGRILGKVKIRSAIDLNTPRRSQASSAPSFPTSPAEEVVEKLDEFSERNLFLPIGHEDGTNPDINVERPSLGIFIYRFSENFTYVNASYNVDRILQTVYLHTQRTDPNTYKHPGDRPWNDPSPRSKDPHGIGKPPLRSIIFDFSAVNNVDSTSISSLHDLRNQLDCYAFPKRVSWHFAHLNNQWTKKALTAAGFGYDRNGGFDAEEKAYGKRGLKPIYNVTNIEEDELPGRKTHVDVQDSSKQEKKEVRSKETGEDSRASSIVTKDTFAVEQTETNLRSNGGLHKRWKKGLMIFGSDRPFFHVDLTSALQSAMAEVKHKETERDTGVLP